MTTNLSLFEEFLVHFETLKSAAKGDPHRISNFREDSQAIRDAVGAMETFLLRTDFERRVFHGAKKHFAQVPSAFEAAWNEYCQSWTAIVSSTSQTEFDRTFPEIYSTKAYIQYEAAKKELKESRDAFERKLTGDARAGKIEGVRVGPDERLIFSYRFGKLSVAVVKDCPQQEEFDPDPTFSEFDPRYHDGGHLIQEAMRYLQTLIEEKKELADDIRVSVGAHEYITETIGLNISSIFRRWSGVPITFMPAHVSNKYSLTEKGSLYDLINDAVRAYVCGAPAAAIAMCRAALEMVLKNHYGKGRWEGPDLGLGKIIVLASQRYNFVDEGKLLRLARSANNILHNYSRQERMSPEDERTILEFLKTVKFLIQRAPA
jgi:hypothetical protein